MAEMAHRVMFVDTIEAAVIKRDLAHIRLAEIDLDPIFLTVVLGQSKLIFADLGSFFYMIALVWLETIREVSAA
jgi:hypothetical protein